MKSLPNDPQSESIVISSAMTDPRSIFHDLPVEAFYTQDNQQMWEIILKLDKNGKPVNPASVAAELPEGKKYTAFAFNDELPSVTAHYHAGLVNECFRKRNAIMAAVGLRKDLEAGESVDNSLCSFEKMLQTGSSRAAAYHLKSLLMPFVDGLEKICNGEIERGIPTGFDRLDTEMPISAGDLLIVAGRPGMGKTSWAISAVCHMLNAGKTVYFASIEMPKEQIVSRLFGVMGRINSKSLRNGDITSDDHGKIARAMGRLAEMNLYIDDRAPLSSSQIRAEAINIQRKHGLDCVVIDHMHLMKEPGFRSGDDHAMFSEAVKGVKSMAKSLGVPVILLAQLNRGVEHRNPPIPKLSDLRETGTIEEMADEVLFLYRQDYYAEQGTLTQVDKDLAGVGLGIVAKNRHGPTSKFLMAWVPQYMSYENLERRY